MPDPMAPCTEPRSAPQPPSCTRWLRAVPQCASAHPAQGGSIKRGLAVLAVADSSFVEQATVRCGHKDVEECGM